MKAFILDGSSAEDRFADEINNCVFNHLASEGNSVTRIQLAQYKIRGCIGCLNCFFKTPGECIFDDLGRKLPHYYVESDAAVFITPVVFGGYSSIMARAYNRMMIQLESHLAETVNGQLRRKKRYRTEYPALLVVGLEKEPDPEAEKVFTSLVDSNAAIHLHALKYDLSFFNPGQGMSDINQEVVNKISFIGS